jgi:AraC-like DNA-binding protein
MKKINDLYQTTVFEKDEHKKSTEYKKLSPKMRDAIDSIFKIMDSKPSDFLNTFEKTIKEVSKKFGVTEKELMRYFEKEMLAT